MNKTNRILENFFFLQTKCNENENGNDSWSRDECVFYDDEITINENGYEDDKNNGKQEEDKDDNEDDRDDNEHANDEIGDEEHEHNVNEGDQECKSEEIHWLCGTNDDCTQHGHRYISAVLHRETPENDHRIV